MARLLEGKVIIKTGKTKNVAYKLFVTEHIFDIKVNPLLQEHMIWSAHIEPVLPELKKNVYDICYHAFNEMMNNIIDHSLSSSAKLVIGYDAVQIHFLLMDYGVGIFRKIQEYLKLEDPRHAVLELAKGKLTTDASRHTGEGIYFTSRICDDFDIHSENIYFHGEQNKDWLIDKDKFNKGTAVFMDINRDSAKTVKDIIDSYCPSENDYGFSRTNIPVKLLRHEGEELVSRSQARRLIVRFDRFKEVILDFEGVKSIGQAFADELFRVFSLRNPEVHLKWINTTEEIDHMIKHVLPSNV